MNASQSKTIVVTNSGTADLNLNTMQIQGIGFDYISTCPLRLGVGKTCTVAVRFTPSAPGAVSGVLTIADDAPGSPHAIALSGSGAQMTVSVGRPDRPGIGTAPLQQPVTVPVIEAEPVIPLMTLAMPQPNHGEPERSQPSEALPERRAAAGKKPVPCKRRKNLPRSAREGENSGCFPP